MMKTVFNDLHEFAENAKDAKELKEYFSEMTKLYEIFKVFEILDISEFFLEMARLHSYKEFEFAVNMLKESMKEESGLIDKKNGM
ncbi:hypothetical protein [Eubacterium oxidoreducens]|uniref:Uncharacterized protein n=1 Tax=Eubacterium oxidoreducens TaxID=1732 RepID=A0A1G6B256_EUBOX|nr:hypothetical protein [Eubacterium oxidoreducens]SDB14696.1 hypothetical protein SAMN02910417_01069 [Eubacterium oxidoreducens]